MVDLAQWLRGQLDDDEAAAEACLPLHLRVGRFRGAEVPRWRITKSGTGIIDEDGGTLRAQQIFPAEADHVIRHDPARVLREIDAKRGLLKLLLSEGHAALRPGGSTEIYCGADYGTGDPCECGRDERMSKCLRLLALPYADRPGYKDAWRP